MQDIKNENGFTMVELAIVLTALAFIMAGVLGTRALINSARISNAQNLTANSPVLNIDGLAFWVETSMIQKDIYVGAITDAVEDISPSGLDLSTISGATYAESTILKGLKSMYFDGNDYLATTAPINATKYTAFAVLNPDNASSGSIIFHNGSGVTHTAGWGITKSEITGTGDTRMIAVTNDTSTKTVYINDGSGTTLTVDNPTTLADAFYVGSKAGTSYFTGEIAEIIVFNRVLFSNEIDDVQTYLKKKYDLSF